MQQSFKRRYQIPAEYERFQRNSNLQIMKNDSYYHRNRDYERFLRKKDNYVELRKYRGRKNGNR